MRRTAVIVSLWFVGWAFFPLATIARAEEVDTYRSDPILRKEQPAFSPNPHSKVLAMKSGQDLTKSQSDSTGPAAKRPIPTLMPGSPMQATAATGLESPNFRLLPYKVRHLEHNLFCLTQELIDSRLELRLLQHGITPETQNIGEEYPSLEVSITVRDDSFSMILDLCRTSTFMIGEKAYKKDSIMWHREVLGIHGHDLEIIFDSLDYLLAEFIGEYLKANQLSD